MSGGDAHPSGYTWSAQTKGQPPNDGTAHTVKVWPNNGTIDSQIVAKLRYWAIKTHLGKIGASPERGAGALTEQLHGHAAHPVLPILLCSALRRTTSAHVWHMVDDIVNR